MTAARRWAGLAAAAAVLAAAVHAEGYRTNVRGVGMAGAAVAVSRELDAVGVNPANLGVPGPGTVTLGLVVLGQGIGSDFLSYDLYRDYFTGIETDSGRIGRNLTEADKTAILDAFPSDEGSLSGTAETRPLGLMVRIGQLGSVALTVTERAAANAVIPRDYVEFLFYGNPPGSDYDFGGTGARAWWTREYAISFGAPIPAPSFLGSLYAGAAFKVVHGWAYFELERFNTRLTTSPEGVLDGRVDVLARMASIDMLRGGEEDYDPFPAPAGSGWGVDLGVSGAVTDYLTAGVSVTDIGSMDWTMNTEELSATHTVHVDDPLDQAQRDSLENLVEGQQRAVPGFSSPLGATLRAGVAVELHKVKGLRHLIYGELLVGFDYIQGLVETPSSTTTAALALGLEYRPWPVMPVRLGVRVGGKEGFNFALGLGFVSRHFDLELGSDNLGAVFSPATFSSESLSLGIRIRI